MAIFQTSHRVTYSQCTPGNHVYYSRYLDILEAARGDFFRHLNMPFLHWQQLDAIFPATECHLYYKSPARYDDLLTIQLWISRLQRVRLNFAYRILNQQGNLVVTGETFHVCTNLAEKPKRLPEDLIERLQPYYGAPQSPLAGT